MTTPCRRSPSFRSAPLLTLVAAWLLTASLLTLFACEPSSGIASTVGSEAAAPTEPRARLRLSGFMHGRLEPCGCASGQLGGLPRRVFHIKQDRNYDLLIEGGNLVAGASPLDIEKLRTAALVLSGMGLSYHAYGIGPADLSLPLSDSLQIRDQHDMPAICSDIVAGAGVAWGIKPYVERKAGDATVRIASLVLSKPDNEGTKKLKLLTPAEGYARAMKGAAASTYRVLLVHGTPKQARAHARLQPRPDLVVGITDLVAEPHGEPEPVDGVPLVFPGTRGRMLLDITLTRTANQPRVTDYRIVKLDVSKTAPGALEDSNTKAAIMMHRFMVKETNILEQMANRLATAKGATYVGSEACGDCHDEAYESWKKTKHAVAWKTLEKAEKGKRYGWPVTAYPDCVSCHVVGYGYKSGFVSAAKTPHLKAVGCEQCHGPGSAHCEDNDIKMGKVDPGLCLTCHDFEQSPGFADDYNARWKKIEHK